MIFFNAKLQVLTVNSNNITERFMGLLETIMKVAARDFALAALRRIPVRTGFVAGTYKNIIELLPIPSPGAAGLASAIGGGSIKSGTFPSRKLKDIRRLRVVDAQRQRALRFEKYKGITKTSESGRQFATPTQSIIRRSGNTITFNWSVDIIYYRIQDIIKYNSPTSPWQSIEAGRRAYLAFLKTKINKARLIDFIIALIETVEYQVNENGTITKRTVNKKTLPEIKEGKEESDQI